ncbi:FAD-dependent oxidoreductase [Rhizobium sp. YTU87027]|uniref:FAD-dependent oxidoreductase n=1 Tax=Rhizobium sp. YTU87027 TaxID=3417741 RepID=UPI003D695669
MDAKSPSIAVVGSGPSGCYAAQFLRKKWPDSEVVVFEALPVPYGLIRYGVAPDHQGNKSVTQQFDRLFERDGIQFVGNITVGRDVPFEELRSSFDVVILATGLESDRRLQMGGDGRHGPTIGAGSLLKALNGHPVFDGPKHSNGLPRHLGSKVAVVGNGNVAMDVIRLLAKRNEHLVGSDVADSRLKFLRTEGIERIDVIGRSPASLAKFDLSMLKEIVSLSHVKVVATGLDHVADDPVSALLLRTMADHSIRLNSSAITVCFHFNARPSAVRTMGETDLLTVEQGELPTHLELEVDCIVTAIGFERAGSNQDEWSGINVFKVGWLNSGGKGAIAANRRDAKDVVDTIIHAFDSGELRVGDGEGISSLADFIGDKAVSFSGWRKIDDWERANALEGRCRQKILNVAEMIDVATS